MFSYGGLLLRNSPSGANYRERRTRSRQMGDADSDCVVLVIVLDFLINFDERVEHSHYFALRGASVPSCCALHLPRRVFVYRQARAARGGEQRAAHFGDTHGGLLVRAEEELFHGEAIGPVCFE